MILKTDTEIMIGCLCLNFFQRALLVYLFTGTSGSFQLSPLFTPILASRPHGSATAGSMTQCSSPFPALSWRQTADTAQLCGWYKPHFGYKLTRSAVKPVRKSVGKVFSKVVWCCRLGIARRPGQKMQLLIQFILLGDTGTCV